MPPFHSVVVSLLKWSLYWPDQCTWFTWKNIRSSVAQNLQIELLDYHGANEKRLQLMDNKPCHGRFANTFKAPGLNITAIKCVLMVVSNNQYRVNSWRTRMPNNASSTMIDNSSITVYQAMTFALLLVYLYQTLQMLSHILTKNEWRADVPWWRQFSCRQP